MLAQFGSGLIAHQLRDLEELAQVKLLLTSNDVQHFVKLVFVTLRWLSVSPIIHRQALVPTYTMKQLTDISGQVKSSTILLSVHGGLVQLHESGEPAKYIAKFAFMKLKAWEAYRKTVFPNRLPSLPGTSVVKSIKTAPWSS